MQVALDSAFYALGATLAVGLLLLGWLAYDMGFGDRFRQPHPDYVRLPCTALDAARDVYDRMKAAYAAASAKERRYLDVHLRRMEERVQYLEDKTLDEHAGYYKAVGRRERLWRGWKALHEQVRLMTRADRKRARPRLEEAKLAFSRTEAVVKEEWSHGIYRDKLLMEELRSIGLLEESYLPKLLEQVRAHTAAPGPDVEEEAWQEPGVESGAQTDAAARALRMQRALNEPEDADDARDASESPTSDKPTGAGLLSYDRIREAIAPLFGQKAPRTAAPPVFSPAVEPPPPESLPNPDAWKPAPPPPRVQATPPATSPVVPVATTPVAPVVAETPRLLEAPALLRQRDLLANGIVAPGRRYLDPTFSVGELPRGILHDADLSGGGFAGVRFVGRHRYLDCHFANADLSGIQLNVQPRAHQFVRCDFSGARFDTSRIGFALFHGCNLSGTRWSGARLERVRFSECVLDGIEWDGADLVETRVVGMLPVLEPQAVSVEAQPADIRADSPAAPLVTGASLPAGPAR